MALAIDGSGNLYMIDDALLEKHGRKLPEGVGKGKIDVKIGSPGAAQADVEGQGRDNSWAAWYAK